MPFAPDDLIVEGDHAWAIARRVCNLADENDPVLIAAVALLRQAYGEEEVIAVTTDPGVESDFDLSAIRRAIRSGMPDPSAEGDKPIHLTNYRSEPAEIVARGGLAQAHGIEFPVSPQFGKSNANMPILGFDGWGLLRENTGLRLILVQAKGTDDKGVPPKVAHALKRECKTIPCERSKLSRTLAILAVFLRGTDYMSDLLAMLEALGNGDVPSLGVAPVIVRGATVANLGDLGPIRADADTLLPSRALGLTISLGVDLAEFGRTVTERARAA